MRLPNIGDDELRLGLSIAAALFLLVALGTGAADMAASATVMIGGLGICLIFLYLSRFKKFKGFGLEAETWEEKMKEAGQLIERLNHLAYAAAAPAYKTLASIGRWATPPSPQEQQAMIDQLDKALLEAGIPQHQVDEMKTPIHVVNLIDINSRKRKEFQQELQKMVEERRSPMQQFTQPYGQDAQLKQKEIMEKQAHLHRVRDAFNEWPGGAYQKYPDQLEQAIRDNQELTDAEKQHLLQLIAPELAAMRAYLDLRRWSADVG